jgi:hypothetical protein
MATASWAVTAALAGANALCERAVRIIAKGRLTTRFHTPGVRTCRISARFLSVSPCWDGVLQGRVAFHQAIGWKDARRSRGRKRQAEPRVPPSKGTRGTAWQVLRHNMWFCPQEGGRLVAQNGRIARDRRGPAAALFGAAFYELYKGSGARNSRPLGYRSSPPWPNAY